MRIVFLLTQSLDSPGGGGRFFPIAKALVQLGHQVTLLALHHDYENCHRRKFVLDGVTVHYVAQMHVRKIGDQKYYFSTPMLLWFVCWGTLQLTLHALKTPCDVLHICKAQPMNGFAGYIVSMMKRVPVFLDSDDFETANNRYSGHWQKIVVQWFEKWIATFVKGITTHTNYIANYYIELGYSKENILVVPHGVDREIFDSQTDTSQLRIEYNVPATAKIVVYVGSMSLTSHAVDLLLHAFSEVSKIQKDVYLMLVGAGEDLQDLKRLADELKISKNVRFVGRVPRESVVHYYRLGIISVDPMRTTIQAESSLSLKIFESLASGVPVISADIGDRKSLLGNRGLIVDPDDKHALTEAIIRVLSDKSLIAQLQMAIQADYDNLFWDQRVQEFSSIYSLSGNESVAI